YSFPFQIAGHFGSGTVANQRCCVIRHSPIFDGENSYQQLTNGCADRRQAWSQQESESAGRDNRTIEIIGPDGGEVAAETSIGTFPRPRVSNIAFLRGFLSSLYEFVAGAIERAVRGFHNE